MLQIEIVCMNVEGNTAFFGGTTRRTNDPTLSRNVFFIVQDFGEPGRGSDRISEVGFSPNDPTECADLTLDVLPTRVIESGNISVRGGTSR